MNISIIVAMSKNRVIGKDNIVLSRSLEDSKVTIFGSLDKALNESRNEEEVFIIGGADLYSQTMNIATKLYLTTIRDEISGDKYFPDFDISKWNIIDSNSYKKNDFNSHDFKSEVFIKNS